MSRPRGGAPRIYAYTFRVRILEGFHAPPDPHDIWREIELRGDQTLAELGEAIPDAFRFDDDHLWSFFLSGKRWDTSTEYTRIQEERGRPADRLRVRDAPAGREFLFLFDYGDEWQFGVKLARTAEVEPGATYPRLVASHGEAPPQYPDLEDWDDDEDEDEDEDEDYEDEDEAAYLEERERLLERFEAWAEQRGASGDIWLAPAMLDYKWAEAEEELTRWTADDLRDLLLEWSPRTMAVPDGKIPAMISSARAFLVFLDDAELLDPAGDRLGTLDATLDWIAPQLEEAMRDVSRFSPAKAAVSAMQAEGVDLNDSRAVERFLADFRLPPEIQLSEQLSEEAPTFPPVALAPLDELRAAAAAAPALRRLRELTEWAGEGRKLTGKGNLTAADREDLGARLGADELDLTLAWARDLRLVRTYNRRLVPVKQQRERLLDDPLELFDRAFDALPRLGGELLPTGMVESAFLDGLAGAIVDLLAALYSSDEAMPVEDLAEHVWEDHVLAGLDEDEAPDAVVEMWRVTTEVEVSRLLAHLQEMGAVEGADPDAVGASAPGGVRLTQLGIWRTNVLLRAAGADAPVIGDLAGADVETLLDRVTSYDEEACRAELRAWCQERGDAARELAAYARSAPGFERQMLALVALEEAGPAAEAEVRAMLDDEALRPQAQLWLVRNGFEDQDSVDHAASTLLMAQSLATILELDGPASLVEQLEGLGPPQEQIAMLEDLGRAPTPRLLDVLDAIGKAHPVAEVSKSARKTALKLRSAASGP